MPFDFLIFKILHLSSVILFVGSIFFITYVVDFVKHENDKNDYKLFASKIGARARKLMSINVTILTISGIYILVVYYDFESIETLMFLKLVLATFIIIVFTTASLIFKLTKNIKWFHHFFHNAIIALMSLVVILSQIM